MLQTNKTLSLGGLCNVTVCCFIKGLTITIFQACCVLVCSYTSVSCPMLPLCLTSNKRNYRLPGLHRSRRLCFLSVQNVIPRRYRRWSFGLWSNQRDTQQYFKTESTRICQLGTIESDAATIRIIKYISASNVDSLF